MGLNGAAIALIILAVLLGIILIVGVSCACMKPKLSGFGVYGMGQNEHKKHKGVADTPSSIYNRPIGSSTDRSFTNMPGEVLERPYAAGQVARSNAPVQAEYPYASSHAPAHDGMWPDSSSECARYPKMESEYGRGVVTDAPTLDDFGYGPTMSVDKLMPASWRKGPGCGELSEDEAEWARYAPSAGAFDRYITAAGSARLALNTRSPLARITGTPNLLRQAPKIPIGAFQSEFLDSDWRQSLIFNATGNYPESIDC